MEEIGTRPVLVEREHDCKECGKVHDLEKCPDCGGWIEVGYGLMGGGMGMYKWCPEEKCRWMWKELETEEDW